jgi:hypothetical protein
MHSLGWGLYETEMQADGQAMLTLGVGWGLEHNNPRIDLSRLGSWI